MAQETVIPENASKNIHATVEKIIRQKLPEESKILDVPCGYGAMIYRLKKYNYEIFAGDIENILMTETDHFVEINMNEPLSFEDQTLDGIICIEGIEHIERPFDFIEECNRVLKKEGVLVITTPNISSLRSRWRFLLTGHHHKNKSPLNEAKPNPLHHINMTGFPEMRYLLHRSGFNITLITTNRIKWISWIYILLLPFVWLKTKLVYNKEEKDADQRKRNKEILGQMISKPILFGESMIVVAKK